MVIASLRNVTYSYPNQARRALDGVSAALDEGSFALVAGSSAGGKSTFLRLFNGLVPQFHGGRLSGEITVAGLEPARTPTRRMATVAGFVFQEPEAQAVADAVEDEIAFGMEQHGIVSAEMRRRLDDLLGALGIEHLRHRRLATLSGGERQRVAIASVLSLEPRLLLLDEPTSQLDPAGAEAVIAAIAELHRERGLTVVLAEHRLERLLPVVDTVIEIEEGRVRALSPRDGGAQLKTAPAVCELGRRFGWIPLPLTVAEAAQFAAINCFEVAPATEMTLGDELLSVRGLTVAYGEHVALREATFAVRQGEIVALVGANGSGKSTLFRAVAGLVVPTAGDVQLNGCLAPAHVQERTAVAGLVPQDPAIALYHESVRDEIAETLRRRGTRTAAQRENITAALEAWNLGPLGGSNPRDLSVGQQQRVAVAAMLAHEPRVWLLDEPTRGADGPAKAWLAERLRAHASAGGAAVVATHDVESAARYATRVISLAAGAVVHDLPARKAFADNGPFPTQTARLFPGAVKPDEVAKC